ncbi:O-antigen ligase family protein [Allorhizocola rhizosphaerae]|uniref:O-antigen ligase family protein n=1 Tax=Allorhizocola rhizosphaerae TaxID=1872709 RepID=UPI000E3BF311|nr:O-antigen ligase family protein [Allorhizocola rhizosphaerae]
MSSHFAVLRAKVTGLRRASPIGGLLLDSRLRIPTALLCVCLAVGPMAFANSDARIYVGIAPHVPTFYTYTGALIALMLLYLIWGSAADWRGLKPWLPFVAWLAIGSLLAWGFSLHMASGMAHLLLGALSFTAGAAAARRDPEGTVVPWTFAVAAWIQLLAIESASFGFPLRQITGPQAPDLVGREVGLTSHPGELAKLLFFCAMFVLVLPKRGLLQRWAVRLTLVAIFLGTSLSQSRTGLVAVVALVVTFVALELLSAKLRRAHLIMLGGVGVLCAASAPWMIARFSADPEGGSRGHVMGVAFRLIKEHPWFGLGPNNYVAVGGASDALTASGVPVHNAFLMSAAELGIVGGALVWLALVLVAWGAVKAVKSSKANNIHARVLVSALPGLFLTANTGWGLLQAPTFLILCLCFGYFNVRAAQWRDAGEVGRTTGALL